MIALITFTFILWITGCMERHFYYPTSGPTPIPAELHGAEAVWFQSLDGTRLHGWFVPANANQREAASGTVLHVHGNAGNILSHYWFTEYLPRAGFNVFVFDYRGYGQSDGAPRKRGPLIADTEAALDAILKRSDVDPNRIAMYGQSLGGAIALNVMAQRPEIKAAVLESPFVSWREMAANALGGETPGWISRTLSAIAIPDSHRPDHAIARIQRPILLLHGTGDSIIPIAHSRKLANAAGQWATLVEVPGGDHNTLRDTNPEIEETVIEFLRLKLDANRQD